MRKNMLLLSVLGALLSTSTISIQATAGEVWGVPGTTLGEWLIATTSTDDRAAQRAQGMVAAYILGVRDGFYASDHQASQGRCSEEKLGEVVGRIISYVEQLTVTGGLQDVRAYIVVAKAIEDTCGSPKATP